MMQFSELRRRRRWRRRRRRARAPRTACGVSKVAKSCFFARAGSAPRRVELGGVYVRAGIERRGGKAASNSFSLYQIPPPRYLRFSILV